MKLRIFNIQTDHAGVIALWEKSGPGVHINKSDSIEELSKKLERDPDLFLVMEDDEKIIGTVIGGFDGRRGMIYHLAVDTSFQNKGIGKQLLDEVERRLKEKGCIRCYLLVSNENQTVLDYYNHRGWGVINVIPLAKDIK